MTDRHGIKRSICCTWVGVVGGAAWAQEARFVEAPPRSVPVIAHADIAVVGGSEGGLAAAWRAAKLGARVVLLNEGTFLGGETVTKDRFDAEAEPVSAFGSALFGSLTDSNYASRFPVVAAGLLREAGVVFLCNTRHGGVLTDGAGRLCGVVTANKAGLQAVVAKVVIDATCAGAVADAAGATRPPWTAQTLAVSRPRYSADRTQREVVTLEAAMPAFTWPLLNRAEDALRETWHLYVNGPFAHGMDFVVPNPITCEATLTAAALPPAGALDLGVCKPAGTERLFVLGSSCAVSREAARELMRPATLADVGERLGERAAEEARSVALPDDEAITVKTADPQQAVLAGLAVREAGGRERPFRLGQSAAVRQERDALPVWGEYDVVVVGSGTSGHAAAIAAGRAGMKTLLVEQGGFIGGSVALGIQGFWRGYLHGFNQEWRGSGTPVYKRLLGEANVEIWYHSLAMGAVLRGNAVEGVEVATWLGRGVALGKVVIDASGDGDVCAAAGAGFFYLNDGDLCLEESSFIGQNLYENSLPADPLDIAGFTTHHVLAGQFAGKQHFPMAQMRETRRIRGDVVIDELDVSAGRTYRDVISIAASAFDPHGYYSSDYSFGGLMPSTKHVAQDVVVYIPLRAVLPAGLENILVVGRCLSATHDAQALVRMNADMLNLGYAAGYAAALCVTNGTTPRQVDVAALQQHLAAIGNLPSGSLAAIAQDFPAPDAAALVAAAADPSLRANLLTLARGGDASRQPLRAALASAPTVAKAKALCLLGDPAGVPLLASWIEAAPFSSGPAYDWEGFLTVPELEGAMWVVAIPRNRQATQALVKKLTQCQAASGFNALRAVTMALGRIGDPGAAPALAAFLGKPGVQGHRDTGTRPESLSAPVFSKAMVELFAASALVRCGDQGGLGRNILTGYLDDWRGIFVRYAGGVLAESVPAAAPVSTPSEAVSLHVAPHLNRLWSTVFTNRVSLSWEWPASAVQAELSVDGMTGSFTTNVFPTTTNFMWQAFATAEPEAEDVYDLKLIFKDQSAAVVGALTSRLAVVKGAFGSAALDTSPSSRLWNKVGALAVIPYDVGWSREEAGAAAGRLVIAKTGGTTRTNLFSDAAGYVGWDLKNGAWGYGTFGLTLDFPEAGANVWEATLQRVQGRTLLRVE